MILDEWYVWSIDLDVSRLYGWRWGWCAFRRQKRLGGTAVAAEPGSNPPVKNIWQQPSSQGR